MESIHLGMRLRHPVFVSVCFFLTLQVMPLHSQGEELHYDTASTLTCCTTEDPKRYFSSLLLETRAESRGACPCNFFLSATDSHRLCGR